jgi:TetR/AcrR family transcriptional repressor of mexJK operon
MAAALEVFLEQGFAATSLEDIASAAPASRQTVYNHFGDKERLFLAVVDRELIGTLGQLRAATETFQHSSDTDVEEQLVALAQRVVDAFASPRTARLRVLVQSEAPRNRRLLELWQERAATPVWSVLIGHLARLAHAGVLAIDDPVRAAGQFVALATGTVWQMTELGTFTAADLTTLDQAQLDQAVLANVGLFVRGYRTVQREP